MVNEAVVEKRRRREASPPAGYRGWAAVGVVLGLVSLISAIVRVLSVEAPPGVPTSFDPPRTSFVVIFAVGGVALLVVAVAAWTRSERWIAGVVVASVCLVGESTLTFGIAGTDSRSSTAIGFAAAAVMAWLVAGSAVRRGARPS